MPSSGVPEVLGSHRDDLRERRPPRPLPHPERSPWSLALVVLLVLAAGVATAVTRRHDTAAERQRVALTLTRATVTTDGPGSRVVRLHADLENGAGPAVLRGERVTGTDARADETALRAGSTHVDVALATTCGDEQITPSSPPHLDLTVEAASGRRQSLTTELPGALDLVTALLEACANPPIASSLDVSASVEGVTSGGVAVAVRLQSRTALPIDIDYVASFGLVPRPQPSGTSVGPHALVVLHLLLAPTDCAPDPPDPNPPVQYASGLDPAIASSIPLTVVVLDGARHRAGLFATAADGAQAASVHALLAACQHS